MTRQLEQLNIISNNVNRAFFIRSDSVGDRLVVQQILSNQDYNLTNFAQNSLLNKYFQTLINSNNKPFIIDAGANIGASVVYFSAIYPQCKILAIEPETNNCDLLRKNCQGIDVNLLEGGISSKNGSLYIYDPGCSDCGFRLGEKGDSEVRVYSATDLILEYAEQGFTPFIFKIDIEGGESELFKEKFSWLKKVPLLIIELHDWLIPWERNSQNFLRTISSYNFDFVYKGENIFCFNIDLLQANCA